MIYNRFPSRGLDLSFEELCGEPSMRWFSPASQGLIQDFARGELSGEELFQVASAVQGEVLSKFKGEKIFSKIKI